MEFDGDLADAEVEGDLFVQAPTRYLTEDLPLSRRETRQLLDILLDEHGFLSAGNVFLDCGGHSVQQGLVSHWLREEVDRPQLHGLNRHGNVAMSGEKNDWRCIALGGEMVLQFETVCTRHPHVENKTPRPLGQTG